MNTYPGIRSSIATLNIAYHAVAHFIKTHQGPIFKTEDGINQEDAQMSTKIWRSDVGDLFHDECFAPEESREGYEHVAIDDLLSEDECASCGGEFFTDDGDEDDEGDVDVE